VVCRRALATPHANCLPPGTAGNAAGGTNRTNLDFDGALEDGDAEIYGSYVVPERIGEGIGRALFAAALHRLREEGYRGVMLWTFTGNARAERFYARAGFRLDGAVRAEKETGVEERRWRAEL
jgi:GNAT superfamily N-acetyltransferase